MRPYPKIDTLFDRDKETFKVIDSAYRRPEFGIIDRWWVAEKIDGTNIRLHFERVDGSLLPLIGGRTNNAQIQKALLPVLEGEVARIHDVVGNIMVEHGLDSYTLYGEGYGAKIQKGGGNYRQDQGFILFDVLVNDRTWLSPSAVRDTAATLGIDSVPVLGEDVTTAEIIRLVRHGFASEAAEEYDPRFLAEGVIAVPSAPLYNSRGDRVIWKLKTKDF